MKAVLSMTFALASLTGCARFEIEQIHSRCMGMTQAISIDAVYASFMNGELLEKRIRETVPMSFHLIRDIQNFMAHLLLPKQMQ